MAPGPIDPQIEPSPVAADLAAQIERFYDLIDTPRVTRDLSVCLCPVCMTEGTRQQIIATTVREMSQELIMEYSNSAHEIAGDHHNVRAFLPRYMDLMARDADVDRVGVGAELHRFGKLIAAETDALSAEQAKAYHDIATLMVTHFGWRESMDHEDIATPYNLLDVFLTGGVPTDVMLPAMDALFDREDVGQIALIQFCRIVTNRPEEKDGRYGPNLFGIGYCTHDVRQDVAAWLRSDAMQDRLQAAYLGDQRTEDEKGILETALDIFPKMDVVVFHDHEATRGNQGRP